MVNVGQRVQNAALRGYQKDRCRSVLPPKFTFKRSKPMRASLTMCDEKLCVSLRSTAWLSAVVFCTQPAAPLSELIE